MSQNPCILFRKELTPKGEYQIAKKYFQVYESRCSVPENSLVVARYSCLPYYKELEIDLKIRNCTLINSYSQHRWIANFDYYENLKDFTPESWNDSNFYQCKHSGAFVVKGKTNSRKHRWNTHMFAEDKTKALDIAAELLADGLIGEQGIIYRKYVPLKVLDYGLHGLPFANEFRFFFYKNKLLSYGYYWSNSDILPKEISQEGFDFAQNMAEIASEYVNFFVLDVAEKEEGGWILVEVNDGQSSGLSENDPDKLYSALAEIEP